MPFGFVGLLCASWAQAGTASMQVNFAGSLVVSPPDCSLDGGVSSNTALGEVHQAAIDGVNYKRTQIEYGLTCQGESTSLTLTLSGMSATFNGQPAVPTGRTDLGFVIYQGAASRVALKDGVRLNFTNGQAPALYAVPTKPAGKQLTGDGDFQGTLTLQIGYQ